MANEMIALNARAPDVPQFAEFAQIAEHAQDRRNAMAKQQQEQNQLAAMNKAYQQAFDPNTGRIDVGRLGGSLAQGGFGSAIPGAQKAVYEGQEGQAKAMKAKLENLVKFSEESRNAFAGATSPQDAVQRAQMLAQMFPDMAEPLQQGLKTLPQDPAQFEAWKQDVLRQNLTADQRLKQELFKIEDADGQHLLAASPYGGRASVVEGSQTTAAPINPQIIMGAGGAYAVDPRTSTATPIMTGGGGDYETFKRSIIGQESGGRYGVANAQGSGAMGVGQVMPATAKTLAGRVGLPYRPELMAGNTPEARQYQDAITEAAVQEAWQASGGDVSTAAAYYHGGSDRAKWGPKTQQYAREVAARVGRGGQLQPPPTAAQRDAAAGSGAPGSPAYSQSAMDAFDRAIESGDRLLKHPGFSARVGSGFDPAAFGSMNAFTGKPFSGTNAADFEAELTAMKAQVFLPMVQSMKGMGALSNAEGEKLTAAIGALDPNMSETAFAASMKRIIGDLNKYKARASGGAAPTSGGGSDIDAILRKHGVLK